MVDFESRLGKIEAELAGMREKISFFNVIYEKFDKTLDKLDERQLEDRKEINEMMSVLQDNIMREIKSLREEMAKQHIIENKKIDELNRWRWFVIGGVAVISWVLSKSIEFMTHK